MYSSGCLWVSLHVHGLRCVRGHGWGLQRPLGVKVEAQDLKGRKFSLNIKHFQARIFQHEYDHLQVSHHLRAGRPALTETVSRPLQPPH